jgi:ribosomal protein L32
VSAQSPSCPNCGTRPLAGRYCRNCGAQLPAPPPPAPTAPTPVHQGHATHWGPPPGSPPLHASHYIPSFPFQPPPRPRGEDSSALAIVVATALLLVLLGGAATVILLVANDDPSHTAVVTQTTLDPSGQARPTTP